MRRITLALALQANHLLGEINLALKPGGARRWNFEADKQIAKIMIAITQRAGRVRRAPMSHPMLTGFGSEAKQTNKEWTRSPCLMQTQ
jgi:hypothetical protein